MVPGEYKLSSDPVPYNVGYKSISLKVKNVGDRAVQVGSHFHFYEANEEGLRFDRDKAFGKRLDIPAGTAVRFEPGEERTVKLIDFGGKRRVFGFNDRVDGYLDINKKAEGIGNDKTPAATSDNAQDKSDAKN
ncbi:urease subunit beta [Lactiplantibacillus plantarum]|uniref:urease subunit beta n=2 Tax=Bacillati TaxID=1783272 RepID=UPI0005FB84DB|nr:urease subunit beta [Lactiplantibacillus plantarum]MCG0573018.1 Urease subunit beta [Lactiplantibacillus plantarum]MCG0810905.1 Urease subunit beta [Lactiplantibacillus plantarum]